MRNSESKLNKFRWLKEAGKNRFTSLLVDECNKLRKYTVAVNMIDSFKSILDEYMDGEGEW